ncbi:MAG: isoleucine--tRNA ligase [bacterium]
MEYKATLHLPQTSFPMKANLVEREPAILRFWEEMGLYERLREQRKDKPRWVLHDGPPYANGHIHIGHALNKILKDFVVKSKSMAGYNAAFIPGWDCHGLPIEHQVEKELGKRKDEMSLAERRRLCREYAEKFVEIQRAEFRRLGVLGDWDRPYRTMDFPYEATIVSQLGKFVGGGSLYKGLKPVHWCSSCQTALAEAEVEYEDHASLSIFVKFPLHSDPSGILPCLAQQKVSVVIWTTTPWTLPANLAVAFHPQSDYLAVKVVGEVFILASALLPQLKGKLGWRDPQVLGSFKGKSMEGMKCRHPFLNQESLCILADYVTLDQGTGAVHTAPGHGAEDYESGIRYGLPIYNPVDDRGHFLPEIKFFGGMEVWEANAAITKKLKEEGMLLGTETLTHAYPHCWRCRSPIIFRATEQWFLSMERNGLRQRALQQIREVKWIPPWGEERIYNMIASRPDWCISRQRVWGIPITVFYCKSCGATVAEQPLFDHVASLMADQGSDIWFSWEAEDLLPPGYLCPQCRGAAFEKEMDILDVWFDSGVSQAVVLRTRADQGWPADMYLEGSDQHRGWFHSSLLAAVGTDDLAPYRSVLTHGFVMDGEGRKMSKSVGNVVSPQEVIDQFGAEILRLWVAAEDYRDDIRISGEILKQLSEGYRKIRNTFRYLLGNLYDFDPQRDRVPYQDLLEIDRFTLYQLQRLIQRIRRAYESYEFHILFHGLHNFCIHDLSAFYLDVLKDRIYIAKADSPLRRAAQTTLYEVLVTLTKLIAPVLSFTAEEVWQQIPKGPQDPESVHLCVFPESQEGYLDEELAERWKRLLTVRDEVLAALEGARKEKLIGNSLEAEVKIRANHLLYDLLSRHEGELAALFIVSRVGLIPAGPGETEEGRELEVRVNRVKGERCERCWNYSEALGRDPSHPTLCPRCTAVMRQISGS